MRAWPAKTEEEIYEALGLPWIPPELRENCGRDRSRRGRPAAPTGGTGGHPRRPAHAHHRNRRPRHAGGNGRGRARRGYEYIAITDHSKALAMANGLDEKRVVAFAKQVREINRDGLGIRVFSGIECDILRDGAMDLAERRAGRARPGDRQRAQPHEPGSAEMTDRLLRALECPHLRVWAIPPAASCCIAIRSRSISTHRGEAARRGVWLEINASPERLDLNGPLIRAAKAKGARFTISTDAHHPKHLASMRYGVRWRGAAGSPKATL
jgi:DNA polymerase (family X)